MLRRKPTRIELKLEDKEDVRSTPLYAPAHEATRSQLSDAILAKIDIFNLGTAVWQFEAIRKEQEDLQPGQQTTTGDLCYSHTVRDLPPSQLLPGVIYDSIKNLRRRFPS